MKRKILTFLTMIMMAVTGVMALAPESAMALGGNCGRDNVLGFKPWYNGLCDGNEETSEIEKPNGNEEITRFVWTIVLNILFDLTVAIGYIALGLVIYGGYLYIMSQGDPTKMARGQKTLANAVIGVIIAMLASILVNTATYILDIDRNAGWNQGLNAGRLQGVFNWAYMMAGLVAIIFIVKSGFNYMLSRGNPEKVRRATQGIIFAAVGLLIVIAAAALTSFILGSVGQATTSSALMMIGGFLA